MDCGHCLPDSYCSRFIFNLHCARLAFSTSPIDLHRRCIYWCWASPLKAILSSAVWPDHSKRSTTSIHGLCILCFSDLCSGRPRTGWTHDWLCGPRMDLLTRCIVWSNRFIRNHFYYRRTRKVEQLIWSLLEEFFRGLSLRQKT